MRKTPCVKDCPDRQPGCHAKCEKYLAWKAEREELLQKIHKDSTLLDGKRKQRDRYYYRMKYQKRRS